MTARTKKDKTLSLKEAFEVEYARRQMERRKREEAERKQQEEDLARAERLYEALQADAEFLAKRELTVDRRRYTVSIDHRDYRVAAYFEAGKASVTSADKRTATTTTAAPRKQQTVDSVEEALSVMAQFLVDETR
ncbi:MAG TPA: hypothetical protein VLI41_15785 [Phenylobacterium sp.]|uniref:hypothetical protein n=1 Tax=Phenylobacterium sp. TaxID=1871053 RepID=UPI002CEEC05C|nr:hypothetical protein [Phenylobacterium sp.]HSV04657.1 hypothetical protein [Phenylobacterium sp.]